MIQIMGVLSNIIVARPVPRGCVCVCFSPRCQTNPSYLEGYMDGTVATDVK